MALKFVNTNNQGATIKFVSSKDFSLGTPIYYRQVAFGNYALSGNNGNKTATINSAVTSGVNDGSHYLYANFSDPSITFNSYLSNISSSGTVITINGINTNISSSGSISFHDYEFATTSQFEKFAQYIVSKKQNGTPNSYTAIKIGEFNLENSNWNSLKDYTESYSGLIPGNTYYLSNINPGKIVNYKTSVRLFTAISRSKAFINLTFAETEILTNQNIIRDTFTGTGSQNVYTLSDIPDSISSTTVFINGLFQIPGDAYTLLNNVITFDGFPPAGSKITVQYLKQYIFAGYDFYMDRKEHNLGTNQEISLSSLFINQDSAQYRFFDLNNPTISGIIYLKNNGVNEPLVRVDTNSIDVTIIEDNTSTLNVYLKLDNLLYFQNKTTNSVSLRIYKET